MIFKKKEFFLLIFLILLQSCSGGKIGNFLQSSFDDLEKINRDEDSGQNLENKEFVIQEKKEINDQNPEKINEVELQKNLQENKKGSVSKKTKISNKKNNSKTKS